MSLWYQNAVAILAILSIIVGNMMGLVQSSPKRMLAYSSIAHAGYMLLVLLLVGQAQFEADSILYLYLVAYSIASTGAFAWIEWASQRSGKMDFTMFSGLSSNRWAIVNMVIVFLSLAGIPLTAGFAGKYYLFASAFSIHPLAVGFALLGSLLSIAYYFRAFRFAFADTQESTPNEKFSWVLMLVSVAILLVGCAPMWFMP
jgi:NADH-quinone oxidoreductase subunit N